MFKKLLSRSIFQKYNKDPIYKINKIKPDKFKNIFSSNNSFFTIDTFFTNISIYKTKLINANELILNISKLSYLDFNVFPESINLQLFFLDDKNRFLNPIEDLENFIQTAIEFITLYNDFVLKTNEVDYNKEHLYIKRLYENLDGLINKLLIIQEEIS